MPRSNRIDSRNSLNRFQNRSNKNDSSSRYSASSRVNRLRQRVGDLGRGIRAGFPRGFVDQPVGETQENGNQNTLFGDSGRMNHEDQDGGRVGIPPGAGKPINRPDRGWLGIPPGAGKPINRPDRGWLGIPPGAGSPINSPDDDGRGRIFTT